MELLYSLSTERRPERRKKSDGDLVVMTDMGRCLCLCERWGHGGSKRMVSNDELDCEGAEADTHRQHGADTHHKSPNALACNRSVCHRVHRVPSATEEGPQFGQRTRSSCHHPVETNIALWTTFQQNEASIIERFGTDSISRTTSSVLNTMVYCLSS